MNFVNKLQSVVDELEEQSSRVNEFSGVLNAINSAREKLDSSKNTIQELSDEHKQLVLDSKNSFAVYEKRLRSIESRIESLNGSQLKTLDAIKHLEGLTIERIDQATDRLTLELSQINVVTSAEFNNGLLTLEKALNEKLNEKTEDTKSIISDNLSAVKTLRNILLVGFGAIVIVGVTIVKATLLN